MNKILYTASFDQTGYGQAAIGNVLSMVAGKMDVVCRHINLGKPVTDNLVIRNLLKGDASNCNISLIHCLPPYFEYSGDFERNIGLFAGEMNQYPQDWVKKLRIMDEICVINKHMKKTLGPQIPNSPIHIVPHAIDLNRFLRIFQPGPIAQIKKETKAHVFYSIGEFVVRKNFETLIKAYLSEFKPYDNVLLFIKTWKDGLNSNQCAQKLSELIDHIKTGLKLQKYPQIQICTDYWSDADIDRLHKEADTYVSSSHGEAWDLSSMASVGFGSTPIVPEHTGYKDYIDGRNGFLTKCYESTCYGALDTFDYLYTGNYTWYDVDIMSLRDNMRKVYTNHRGCVSHRKDTLKTLEKFSYSKIGLHIKKVLGV